MSEPKSTEFRLPVLCSEVKGFNAGLGKWVSLNIIACYIVGYDYDVMGQITAGGTMSEEGKEVIISQLPLFYCNSIRSTFGLFDFQVMFGTAMVDNLTPKDSENPETVLKPQCVTHFSPEHFKQMVRIFTKQLEEYEERFGTIIAPPHKE